MVVPDSQVIHSVYIRITSAITTQDQREIYRQTQAADRVALHQMFDTAISGYMGSQKKEQRKSKRKREKKRRAKTLEIGTDDKTSSNNSDSSSDNNN